MAAAPTYIEFGAGKGMLSLGICSYVPAADLLLVEREGGVMRTRADRLLRERQGRGERALSRQQAGVAALIH